MAWTHTVSVQQALSFIHVQPLTCFLPAFTAIQSNRQRAYNLTLHSDVGSTAKHNFIPRMLCIDQLQMIMCMFWTYITYRLVDHRFQLSRSHNCK